MADQSDTDRLIQLIASNAPSLRRAWRDAARFDDLAEMHVTNQGEQMLIGISAQLSRGADADFQKLVAAPPWTGNEADADAPGALLLSLRMALEQLTDEAQKSPLAVDDLVHSLAAAIDAAQRSRIRDLEDVASIDALTGALSRRAVLARLDSECARTLRHGRPLSVLFLDVVGLKATNDERGHRAGDDVLKALVEQVSTSTRTADSLGRLGGDEFLLILPETDSLGARTVSEKLQELLTATETRASIGAASTPEIEAVAGSLVDAADASMREARASQD